MNANVRIAVLTLLLLGIADIVTPASAPAQHIDSPRGTIRFVTIHTDGEKVLMINRIPVKGETEEKEYKMTVPITGQDGRITYRAVTRTLTVPKVKTELQPVPEEVKFFSVSGEEIDYSDVVAKTPMAGKQVIVLPLQQKKISPEWKQLIKDDVIIMRSPIAKGTGN